MPDTSRKTNAANAVEIPTVADWRFKLGVALIVLSLFGPLVIIPLVASLNLSAAVTTSISGAVLVGADVLLVVAAAVMGKSGFTYIKNWAFGLLKQYAPTKEVSKTRYNIGLMMFAIPILFGWLLPYIGTLVPGYEGNEITFAIAGDLLLLISLFVLGGDFWDKLRALYSHEAKAVLVAVDKLDSQITEA